MYDVYNQVDGPRTSGGLIRVGGGGAGAYNRNVTVLSCEFFSF